MMMAYNMNYIRFHFIDCCCHFGDEQNKIGLPPSDLVRFFSLNHYQTIIVIIIIIIISLRMNFKTICPLILLMNLTIFSIGSDGFFLTHRFDHNGDDSDDDHNHVQSSDDITTTETTVEFDLKQSNVDNNDGDKNLKTEAADQFFNSMDLMIDKLCANLRQLHSELKTHFRMWRKFRDIIYRSNSWSIFNMIYRRFWNRS